MLLWNMHAFLEGKSLLLMEKELWKVYCAYNGWRHAKISLGICRKGSPRSACTSTQSDQGLHCVLAELLDTIECINGEQRPGPSCSKLTMLLVNVSLKL